jgi:hypothetical protein
MSAWGICVSSEASRRSPALVLVLAAVVALGAAAHARQRPGPVGELTSAEECGRCHQDIHRYWKASQHAQSSDSPRFQQAFLKAKADSGADPGCLICHAPASVYMRDAKWEKKTSWEGVTCDFCHSVRAIKPGSDRPFVIEAGPIKTGPLKGAMPTVHGAAFSEVYTSSTLCAPCHQYTNDKKFDVLTTYAEWQASPYPGQSTTCQSCHMRATTGNIVDPKVARTGTSSINIHEMPGGHSVTELNRALQAQITAERKGEAIEVTVTVANRGAGHRLPTGSPLRAIVMIVEADNAAGARQIATRTFGRVVVDGADQELKDEAGVFQRAAKAISDNRLAPGERRIERFSFPMPRTAPVRALARFYYRYAPDAIARPDPGTPFLSINAWVNAGQ